MPSSSIPLLLLLAFAGADAAAISTVDGGPTTRFGFDDGFGFFPDFPDFGFPDFPFGPGGGPGKKEFFKKCIKEDGLPKQCCKVLYKCVIQTGGEISERCEEQIMMFCPAPPEPTPSPTPTPTPQPSPSPTPSAIECPPGSEADACPSSLGLDCCPRGTGGESDGGCCPAGDICCPNTGNGACCPVAFPQCCAIEACCRNTEKCCSVEGQGDPNNIGCCGVDEECCSPEDGGCSGPIAPDSRCRFWLDRCARNPGRPRCERNINFHCCIQKD